MCGEIGLTIKQFDNLDWKQLNNITEGYFKRKEAEERRTWEQTRWVMYIGLLPHQKKNSELTLQKVLEFPWDEENKEFEAQEVSAEAVKESIDFWNKQDSKNREVEQ